VTERSGARDERAAGEAGDAAARDDDLRVRALRAVWSTMRDHDPPDSGLGALLAAARVKAESMQPRTSRWRRLAAVLRRPPVLAFATVVVLIGGGVLVSQRIEVSRSPRPHDTGPPRSGEPVGSSISSEGRPAAQPAALAPAPARPRARP
jgi:hypothetical protein